VFFHGKLSQPEIADWAAKADLFVLPSRLEGFGKATIEAAATGLPAVIFADYEADTVLDGISGYQVRTDQELTDAVQRLLSDSELRLRMGRAAASSAERFGWDRLARQWEAILATAIRFSTDAKSARISIRGESP
jgi:glycosyltransferase involved in cell wall biosynthesis